jgi:hypothetical protein
VQEKKGSESVIVHLPDPKRVGYTLGSGCIKFPFNQSEKCSLSARRVLINVEHEAGGQQGSNRESSLYRKYSGATTPMEVLVPAGWLESRLAGGSAMLSSREAVELDRVLGGSELQDVMGHCVMVYDGFCLSGTVCGQGVVVTNGQQNP